MDFSILGSTLVSVQESAQRSLHCMSGRFAAKPAQKAWTMNLQEHVIFPALVNGHEHLHLNLAPRPDFQRHFPNSYAWIEAFQAHFQDPTMQAALKLDRAERLWHGALKNLLSGVGLVAHHDPWHPCMAEPDFPVTALREMGWCHSLGLAGRYGPGLLESYAKTPAIWPWMIHLAEGIDEIASAELDELQRMVIAMDRTVLIHAVGLSSDQQRRFLQAGGGIVWCPSSNLAILGQSLDPHAGGIESGRLCLGTDARISGAADLLEEMRLASERWGLSGRQLLFLVTENARQILRQPEQAFADGAFADFFVVASAGTEPTSVLRQLHRKDIRAIVRQGQLMVADPDLAEWFSATGIEPVSGFMDGQRKLFDPSLLKHWTAFEKICL